MRSPLRLVINLGLVTASVSLILALLFFLSGHWALGTTFLLLALSVLALLLKGLLEVSAAKVRAIRRGEREVELFFRWAKLVLWEANEGLLFLKNKRVSEVVYGPERGGGMRLIFPVLGEEIKVHVPLTIQLSEFYDENVLTRESIQLSVKLALWWRIKDREGLEKYYREIGKEVHHLSDKEEQVGFNYNVRQPSGPRKSPERAELNAAQKWLKTLEESCLRKLVSKTSVALIVSNRATRYLHVPSVHEEQTPATAALLPLSQVEEEVITPVQGEDATPDALAKQLLKMLKPEAERYGLKIDQVEVLDVQLPGGIQESIDRVWKATLLPAQTSQEARARYNQIKVELEAVKDVLGVDNAAIDHILKNVKGMKFYGGLPEPIEQLLSSIFRKAQQEPPKLPGIAPHLPNAANPAAGPPSDR